MTALALWASIGPLVHDPDEVRSLAEDLLSRAPFADGEAGPLRRVLRQVGDAVAAFLSGVFGDAVATGLLPWVMVVLGVALLGWLVWRITRGLSVDRDVAEVPAETHTRTAADWHADADAAEARGELRQALRSRYAAIVASLLAEGRIEDVPGRTVRELDAEVASSLPTAADDVGAAGERFDAVVYGHREATREDLEVVAVAARVVDATAGSATERSVPAVSAAGSTGRRTAASPEPGART